MVQLQTRHVKPGRYLAEQRKKHKRLKDVCDSKVRNSAETLAEYERENIEQACLREYGRAIRQWRSDMRFQLTGKRRKELATSLPARILDRMLDKWSAHKRPLEGIELTLQSITRKFSVTTDAVAWALRTLKREGIIRSRQSGRGKGKGWGGARYTFPGFPEFEPFRLEFLERDDASVALPAEGRSPVGVGP